jgi:hypothetical protein
MQGMVRWSRALASLLLAFGLLASAWTNCVEGATSTATEQMACCKGGHDDCPMKDSASECCRKSGPRIEWSGTIAKAGSFSSSSGVPVLWGASPALSFAPPTQTRVSLASSPPELLHAPPAYIAFSGLLI